MFYSIYDSFYHYFVFGYILKFLPNSNMSSVKTITTRTNRRRRARIPWAVPPTSLVTVTINYTFPESGSTQVYEPTEAVSDTTNICRAASMCIQYSAPSPVVFIVRAGDTGDQNPASAGFKYRFTTSNLLASTDVKTLRLRYPRNNDYSEQAAWEIVSEGPMTVVGWCSFTLRNVISGN